MTNKAGKIRKTVVAFITRNPRQFAITCVGGLAVLALLITGVLNLTSMVRRLNDYEELQTEYSALQTEHSEIQAEYSEVQKELSATSEELGNTVQQLADTREKLAYSENQMELYKESTNALTEQVASLNAIKEDLNNQLEDLLHVQESVPVITRDELEQQINSLSELVTIKYIYRNAAQKTGEKTWLWGWPMPFSDVSLLATYDGTITAGIDLKDVKFSVGENTKTIFIEMPRSRIFDHNIPPETINILKVENNLFNSITLNDYNQFISAEKKDMAQQAIDRGILEDASNEAEAVIEAFLKTIPGIEAYTLKFIPSS